MNLIEAKLDKSDYGYDNFLNYRIDNYWLDEKLEELYKDSFYNGLVPTLLNRMEMKEEEEIVWSRILPNKGEITKCPILMCPDDNDFSCTIIIAEIENCEEKIIWKQLGIDLTNSYNAEEIGSNVDWFDKIKPFHFEISNYMNLIREFRKQYTIDPMKL